MAESVGVEAASKTKGGKLWIAMVLMIAAAAAGWWLRGKPSTGNADATGTTVGSVLHLESFVLNLADPDQKAYLRVGIDLGLRTDYGSRKDSSEVPTSEVRDVLLTVLTQCRPDDLLTPQGKAKLKNDLVRTLQQRVPQLGVREVYFTEFLVQR